ncbi:hypothetical protein JCM6882_006362, partial [Rhodosporidiobolus microsporus]
LVASLLYPAYASYKVLRLPSGSAEQREGMERWLMFWCVMCGVWVWEEVGEWWAGWFPFYYELKTLAILWLVLPQIQGSTYLYTHHLSPFLTAHESDIDLFVANLRSSALALGASYLQRAIRAAKQAVLGSVLADVDAAAGAPPPPPPGQGADAHAPPLLADPPVQSGAATPQGAAASSLAAFAAGLVRQYAPAAVSAGRALLRPNEGAGGAGGAGGKGVSADGQGEEGKRRRRDELRRELASLGGGGEDELSSASGFSSGSGSDGLRERSPTPSTASSIPSSLSPASSPSGPGGGTPRDPVAHRVMSNLGSSLAGSAYEELTHDEARGFAVGGGGEGAGKGGWFGWGGGAQGEEGKGKGGKDA